MRVVLIQAGGVGNRVGADMPKQFIKVNEKPIIAYTLEKFQRNNYVDDIWIVYLANWKEELIEICNRYHISKLKGIVEGGKTIFQSTKKGLDYMPYTDNPLVMIHEAVRPLITDTMISDSFITAEKYGNAVASTKVVDEVGVIDGNAVNSLTFSSNLYTIQNPHTFHLDQLRWAYKEREDIGTQGTAVLMYKLGVSLYHSQGHPDCFKITYKEDIARFKALLSNYNL